MFDIGLFDSGSGGLNILKFCLEKSPNFRYVYYVDDLNAPFGDKTKEEIKNIALNAAKFLIEEKNVKVLIIACNTATAVAIEDIREKYKKTLIIGVEPPLLPALREHKKGKILVFATPATLKYNKLLNKFQLPYIHKLYIKKLPKLIDDHLENLDYIQNNLKAFNEIKNVEAVVLGCTHFYAIKKLISNALGERPKYYFSGEGVSEFLFKKIGKGDKQTYIEIISSLNKTDYLYKYFYEKIYKNSNC